MTPAIVNGIPIHANSKKPNVLYPASPKTIVTVLFGGVPTKEIIPPKDAIIAKGKSNRPRAKPPASAIPIQTGSITATVPVLLKTEDNVAVKIITPNIITDSLPREIFTTKSPINFATPVSKSAPPTTNMPANKMTLLFDKPLNALLGLTTPVTVKAIGMHIDVTAKGMISVINKTAAMPKTTKVIIAGAFDAVSSSPAAKATAVTAKSKSAAIVSTTSVLTYFLSMKRPPLFSSYVNFLQYLFILYTIFANL